MNLPTRQTRIPTLLGLGIIIVGLAAGTILSQSVQHFTSQAAPEIKPQAVKITNRTDTTVSISWTTAAPTTGFITYGKNSDDLDLVAMDDAGDIQLSSTTHHVTLKKLQPNTTYAYTIQSNEKTFDDNGTPFTLKTAPTLTTKPPEYGVLRGTINGGEQLSALVYVTIDDTTLSTRTHKSERWTIPLTEKRTADGQDYLLYPPKTKNLEIFVQAGEAGVSRATYPVTFEDQLDIPPMTLGQTHTFSAPLKATEPEAPPSPQPAGFGQVGGKATLDLAPEASVSSSTPTFSGTGPPGEPLTITVESDPITSTIIVEEDGTWRWTTPTELEPGEHTITIQTPDGEVITRTFTVGGEPPQARASPTPSPSPSPTPTPTPLPTATPTASPSAPPIGGPTLPDTANSHPMLFLIFIGAFLIIGGIVSSGLFRKQPHE